MAASSDDEVMAMVKDRVPVREIMTRSKWPRQNVTRLAIRNGYLIDPVTDRPHRDSARGGGDSPPAQRPPRVQEQRPLSSLSACEHSRLLQWAADAERAATRRKAEVVRQHLEELAAMVKDEEAAAAAELARERERDAALVEVERARAALEAALDKAVACGALRKRQARGPKGVMSPAKAAQLSKAREARAAKRQQGQATTSQPGAVAASS
jgi:hypothetical protein